MTEDHTDDAAVAALIDHLEATAERPVERSANRWLGEAEAVATDLADCRDDAVIAARAAIVVDLLEEVETTGDETADEHVAAAREIAERLTAR